MQISIHTALAGCDDITDNVVGNIKISIHTALAGCDLPIVKIVTDNDNFNPHSPRRL